VTVTNKWTPQDLPDLRGRTIIVTGASSGIGQSSARELAKHGAKVILAVRDVEKGARVASQFSGDTEVRLLDVADLESVRAFASDWRGPIDSLINNAGIMLVPAFRTIDDFELHIGTNHMGPFALTNLLLPNITNRVVTVSSFLHFRGRIHLEDLNFDRRPYRAINAYEDSKLANMLFAFELQRRLDAAHSPVRSIAVHPGIARTNLISHVGGINGAVSKLSQGLFNSEEQGAWPTLFATTQDIPGGSYVGPRSLFHLRGSPSIQRPSRRSRDETVARQLWDASAVLTGTGA
jgi:NAD(P)-dependent dehydrogenase (short-subunit alcohol dehydrogenase family)